MAGLVPAIHGRIHGIQDVDARAFAAPKGLRPRRRDKPGHDELVGCIRMTPHLRLGVITAVLVLALDQASKLWLLFVFDIGRRGAVAVAPFFDLVLAWNTGISYGWFSEAGPVGQAVMLGIKAVAVVALAIWMARSTTRTATVGLGLIIGGAIGNAIDRLAYGAVVDFALFHVQFGAKTYNWYVFNLADVAIVVGVAALLYDSFAGQPAAKAP
jgi:signal peptidase II